MPPPDTPRAAWPRAVFTAWLAAAVLAVPGAAQPAADDAAFEKKLATVSAAEEFGLLMARAQDLGSVDPARAVHFAERARKAATRPHDELMADVRIATLRRQRGEYADAHAIARTALARAAELGDDVARAELLLAYARTHWSLGDYPAAMTAHQELIALATKLGNRRLVARGHLGLSVVYGEMKDRVRARAEEEVALAIARELGDRETESDALNNLGNNFFHAGDLARAREMHEQSLAIRADIGNRRGVGDSHVNLAEIAAAARDFPDALDHATQALALYEKIGLPRYIANAHLQLAIILRASGRTAEALARLNTGFSIAEPLGSASQLVSFYQEFAVLGAVRGDWQAAYDAERKRAAIADTLMSDRIHQQLSALSSRFQAERHDQEVALLRGARARQEAELRAKNAELISSSADLETANAMHFALGSALLALAAVLGAVIYLQRSRLRAERRLLAETQSARSVAEEADRVKTRFLGIASHDIRAPLGNIVSLAEAVRLAPGERADRLDLITSEAQRVLCLVEDFLTIAALETGRLELKLARLDLTEVVRAAVDGLHWQAQAKRQTLAFFPVAPHTGVIEGDAARLHQVVSNLIANAIKFSPAGASVALELTRVDHTVTLSVRDEGPGLAPDEVTRLFAPFQRLASHPGIGHSSHGLGLSIVHEIVRLHGGRVRVQSAPGDGATFFVELPVGRATA